MTFSVKNERMNVYSSKDAMFQESELPAHFSTSAHMMLGSESFGCGDVTVTNRRIVFVPSGDYTAVAWEYRSMVMHAVTSVDEGRKNIFIQLVTDEDDQEGEQDIVSLVPVDQTTVYPLFEAINEMSALNPDEETMTDDELVDDEEGDEEAED